ncbi:hypothetical protein BCR42DRAFT_492408 [Absidia repens]|uniref:DUF7719 domain-containing protein n=1 Tax=Absidia repens TaxID=90262 RepID=A0A1X2IDN1_9FUNG|nr:hypothetical protein BCR42DRAFT_492408 [Absidia repens]
MANEPLVKRIPTKKPSSSSTPTQDEFIQQKAGGLFEQAKLREAELKRQAQQQSISTAQYIWQAIFLSIPFGLLLAAFDVTVKVQFDEPWDYYGLFLKTVKSAPALCPFIYLTNRHKSSYWTQGIMTAGSLFVGAFLLYTLQHSPSLGQMLRAPGLATIWVYFIVQLDLLPAVASLLLVAAYWYFGLQKRQK